MKRKHTMKKLIPVCILTIILFGILTIKTAKIEGPSDGDDLYGFPFTFFIRFSGNCDPCPPNPIETEIYFLQLLLDLLFAAIIPILGWAIFAKVKNNLKNKKSGV